MVDGRSQDLDDQVRSSERRGRNGGETQGVVDLSNRQFAGQVCGISCTFPGAPSVCSTNNAFICFFDAGPVDAGLDM